MSQIYGAPPTSPGTLLIWIAERSVTPRPDCVIWTRAVDRGYGRIGVDGKSRRVHRLVWELTNGPIPDDLVIDHLCRVRSCVNPAHMELVTPEENTRRSVKHRPKDRAGNQVYPTRPLTHCKNGHELSPKNTRVNAAGARRCLSCLPPPRTHCSKGHELTPENARVVSNGERRCRTCQAASDAARNQRLRASP